MDAYRILGVQPTADEAVLRAAYLALMKRFHPDQPGADVERAKEIAAAYQLLCDPARRAAHDRRLAEERVTMIGARSPMAPPRKTRQTGRTSFFALSLVAAGLLALVVSQQQGLPPISPEPPATKVAEASKGPEEVALAPPPPPAPSEPPASPQPIEEREEIAEAPSQRERRAEEPALPPDRPTVAPQRERAELPKARTKEPEPVRVVAAAAVEEPKAAKAVQPAAVRLSSSGPQKIDLKALERHQLILYNQSFLAGTERKRALLLESRTPFMRKLEACGSDTCRRDVYLSRNQEIARIMGL